MRRRRRKGRKKGNDETEKTARENGTAHAMGYRRWTDEAGGNDGKIMLEGKHFWRMEKYDRGEGKWGFFFLELTTVLGGTRSWKRCGWR